MVSFRKAAVREESWAFFRASNLNTFPTEQVLLFTCYGARIGIFTNDTRRPSVLDALLPLLPPGWQPLTSAQGICYYLVDVQESETGGATYTVWMGSECLVEEVDQEVALDELASALHVTVSCHAPDDWLFVHAGVVAWNDRALVIPGVSHSGKTTLVKALVEAGATYYSDEFAVFDRQGRVHPYARPLGVRDSQGQVTKESVQALGGHAGTEPLPVALIVSAQYQPGAVWQPTSLSAGQGALRLLENTVLARTRSALALQVFERVMHTATALAGTRGEAASLALHLQALFVRRVDERT